MATINIESINNRFHSLYIRDEEQNTTQVHDAFADAWQEAYDAVEIPAMLNGVEIMWDGNRVWFDADEEHEETAEQTAQKVADKFEEILWQKLEAIEK